MYLSKAHVAWPKTRGAYGLHQAIWTLFPGHERDPRGFLFRVEAERRGFGAEILIQSEWPPEPRTTDVRMMASRPYQPRLSVGLVLRFRLTGNPIKTITDEKGRLNAKGEVKSCRVPLIKEEQQLEWLRRKLQPAVRLESAVAHAVKPIYFRKGNRVGKVVAVTFDGLFYVNDTEKLWQQMQIGIGPAKGFGCGLLSIARA
jgi:CRISPR system Cascade subunit CasE